MSLWEDGGGDRKVRTRDEQEEQINFLVKNFNITPPKDNSYESREAFLTHYWNAFDDEKDRIWLEDNCFSVTESC